MLNIKKQYINKVVCITHPKLGVMHLNFKTLNQEDLAKLNKLGLDIFEKEYIVDPIHGDKIELIDFTYSEIETKEQVDKIVKPKTKKKKDK